MYQKHVTTLRWTPELHTKIEARASEHGLSVNAWIIKAIEYTLAAKDPNLTVRTEQRYTL